MRAVGNNVFLWQEGDVNPLIDHVDTAKIRGLKSPARRTQPQSNPREVYPLLAFGPPVQFQVDLSPAGSAVESECSPNGDLDLPERPAEDVRVPARVVHCETEEKLQRGHSDISEIFDRMPAFATPQYKPLSIHDIATNFREEPVIEGNVAVSCILSEHFPWRNRSAFQIPTKPR